MTSPQPRQKVATYLLEHPGATITEITAATKLARSTVTKALKAMEKANLVTRTRAAKPGAGDQWRPLLDTTPGPADDPPVAADGPDATAPDVGNTAPAMTASPVEGTPKLAPGGLRALVKKYFAEHPGTVVTAGDVAKFLNRSPGAVHNAIQVLVREGLVRLDSEPPRRYTAAPLKKDQPAT